RRPVLPGVRHPAHRRPGQPKPQATPQIRPAQERISCARSRGPTSAEIRPKPRGISPLFPAKTYAKTPVKSRRNASKTAGISRIFPPFLQVEGPRRSLTTVLIYRLRDVSE